MPIEQVDIVAQEYSTTAALPLVGDEFRQAPDELVVPFAITGCNSFICLPGEYAFLPCEWAYSICRQDTSCGQVSCNWHSCEVHQCQVNICTGIFTSSLMSAAQEADVRLADLIGAALLHIDLTVAGAGASDGGVLVEVV
jgi:hypothetical protein